MALNAHITGIRSRNPVALWFLRLAVRICGAELRIWRSRTRKEKAAE